MKSNSTKSNILKSNSIKSNILKSNSGTIKLGYGQGCLVLPVGEEADVVLPEELPPAGPGAGRLAGERASSALIRRNKVGVADPVLDAGSKAASSAVSISSRFTISFYGWCS